jgi:serine/threonine protein kinase
MSSSHPTTNTMLDEIQSERCLKLLSGGGKSQFVARWQVSIISPCMECSKQLVREEEYSVVGTIGKGSFGSVMLVEERETGEMFAMKVIDKGSMVKQEQVKHTVQERRIMASVSFPFLVKLESHFQTRTSLCLVMELVSGGELFSHLRSVGSFGEDMARFYLREILVSMEYMHSLGVVYRDLKPENILLDKTGHVKITDFGFSTLLSHTSPSWTLCGTPEYLAPEVILGQGHGRGVDWWAMGILAYEMCAGVPPYTSDKEAGEARQVEIYEQIISSKLICPGYFSYELVDLVTKLLSRYPENRLGVVGSVREHSWFRETNWGMVMTRRMTVPFVPGDRSQDWLKEEKGGIEEGTVEDEDDVFKDF